MCWRDSCTIVAPSVDRKKVQEIMIMVHKSKDAVLKHLKEDSETWLELSKRARKEYDSDVRLMKKIMGSC